MVSLHLTVTRNLYHNCTVDSRVSNLSIINYAAIYI